MSPAFSKANSDLRQLVDRSGIQPEFKIRLQNLLPLLTFEESGKLRKFFQDAERARARFVQKYWKEQMAKFSGTLKQFVRKHSVLINAAREKDMNTDDLKILRELETSFENA